MPTLKQTITTSSAAINVPIGEGKTLVLVKNPNGSGATITIGTGVRDNTGSPAISPTLTTSSTNGFDLAPGEQAYIVLTRYSSLYAIASTGTPVLNVFWIGD